MNSQEILNDRTRAEDILLGSLGFGEEATFLSVAVTENGYTGTGVWPDGEEFSFESDGPLDELEEWALKVVLNVQEESAA